MDAPKNLTVRGSDVCDVRGCSRVADIILDSSDEDRFCAGHIDIARKIAQSYCVPPRWYNIVGQPTYAGTRVIFPVRALT